MPQVHPTLIRTPLCCGRCQKCLGEVVELLGMSIFLGIKSDHGRNRITVGPLPNFIECEDCFGRGRWENPNWVKPPELDTLLPYLRAFVESLPRAPLPERNFAAAGR